ALAIVLVVAAAALLALAEAPAASRRELVLGRTALVCPFLIAMVSMPVLAGLLAVLRRLAPTRPLAAGAAAGLLGGAAGTMVYALHCPETGLPFVALWYTAGILLTTLLGAGLGKFCLRW
ncbi:NrsF family protein, partial [Paracoccus binzhouensis]|uniref:NrsF family protein n=1 Tax=Paracoccus binzhouensis TaxID=2796149 RepID=UPI0018EF0562